MTLSGAGPASQSPLRTSRGHAGVAPTTRSSPLTTASRSRTSPTASPMSSRVLSSPSSSASSATLRRPRQSRTTTTATTSSSNYNNSSRHQSPTKTVRATAATSKTARANSTVLDQLHAEQKSTIEALTQQVEFYRQREQRHRRELDALRAATNGPGGVTVTRLMRENRSLQDELAQLQSQQRAWGEERQRLQRQLDDATTSLQAFAQGVDALESKMQHKDLELENLQSLRRECSRIRDELERERESTESLRRQLTENEERHQRQLRDEIGARDRELEELRTFLERANERATSETRDAQSRNHELSARVVEVERAKGGVERELQKAHEEIQRLQGDLQATKARLSTKDHAVVVSTLRSELSVLKERLRAEFQHEKEAIRAERESLLKEVTLLTTRVDEKEQFIRRLQEDLLIKDNRERELMFEASQQRSIIENLEREVKTTQSRYEDLVHARTSLAEQLDVGFKELLQDESAASAAKRQVETLQKEIADFKRELAARDIEVASTKREIERCRETEVQAARVWQSRVKDLEEQLVEKDKYGNHLRDTAERVAALERESAHWKHQVAIVRAELELEISRQQESVDHLRKKVEKTEKEKDEMHTRVISLEEELSDKLFQSTPKDLELVALKEERAQLNRRLTEMQDRVEEATRALDTSREERNKRERKLLRERQKLEDHLTKLVERIDAAGVRNSQLGEKIISLVRKSKADETEIVAMNAQIKSGKEKIAELEKALSTFHKHTSRDNESKHELKRRLHEVTALKESYQVELNQLRKDVREMQCEKESLCHQRDEARNKISKLMKCQQQMTVTVETHTAELVEEIEALQNQLGNERQRCAVLLANEKTLLRDITEKTSALNRLQQRITTLEQQPTPHPVPRKPTPPLFATPKRHLSVSPPPRPVSPAKTQSSSNSSSARELDRLLGNLERISEFSTRQGMHRR